MHVRSPEHNCADGDERGGVQRTIQLLDCAQENIHIRIAVLGKGTHTSIERGEQFGRWPQTPARRFTVMVVDRKHLMQGDTETVLVRARVHMPTFALFRRHVSWCPYDCPRMGQIGVQPSIRTCRRVRGQPEVGHMHGVIPAYEHVVRFEVAMNKSGPVCRSQSASCLKHDRKHFAPAAAAFRMPVPQRSAFHELHCNE